MARFSFGFVQFLIPSIHLALGVFAVFNPSLYSVGACFLAFKALDYSLFRSSKELLFIALPFDARYRTKSIIDIVGYRASKGISSGFFAVLEHFGARLTTVYAWAGIVCVGAWLFIAPALVRHVPERVKNLRRKKRGS
jgi:ATP/ADP translocase